MHYCHFAELVKKLYTFISTAIVFFYNAIQTSMLVVVMQGKQVVVPQPNIHCVFKQSV